MPAQHLFTYAASPIAVHHPRPLRRLASPPPLPSMLRPRLRGPPLLLSQRLRLLSPGHAASMRRAALPAAAGADAATSTAGSYVRRNEEAATATPLPDLPQVPSNNAGPLPARFLHLRPYFPPASLQVFGSSCALQDSKLMLQYQHSTSIYSCNLQV